MGLKKAKRCVFPSEAILDKLEAMPINIRVVGDQNQLDDIKIHVKDFELNTYAFSLQNNGSFQCRIQVSEIQTKEAIKSHIQTPLINQ